LRENVYKGLLSGFFILGLLKIGGSEMCDVLSGRGVPGCVTKCDRGRETAPKSSFKARVECVRVNPAWGAIAVPMEDHSKHSYV